MVARCLSHDDVLHAEHYTLDGTVYCLTVEHDHNFCITDQCINVANCGKSTKAIVQLLEEAFKRGRGIYWWMAPVYPQARIAFRRMWAMLQGLPADQRHCTKNPPMIELFGGRIVFEFKSADNIDNLYGEDVQAAVIDEATRVKPSVWTVVNSVTHATKGRIFVEMNVTDANNWAYRRCREADRGELDGAKAFKFAAEDAVKPRGPMDAAEVESARKRMDPAEYDALFRCIPRANAGLVYYNFDERMHVAKPDDPRLLLVEGRPLCFMVDFNIRPGMYAGVGQYNPATGEVVIVDELFGAGRAVDWLAKAMLAYIARPGVIGKISKIELYGDYSGHSRVQTTGDTNWQLLVRDLREGLRVHGVEAPQVVLRVEAANPKVQDRVNSVNYTMMDASGFPRFICSPRCERLINDFKRVAYGKDGDLDKKTDVELTHASDGLGYFVHRLRVAGIDGRRRPNTDGLGGIGGVSSKPKR